MTLNRDTLAAKIENRGLMYFNSTNDIYTSTVSGTIITNMGTLEMNNSKIQTTNADNSNSISGVKNTGSAVFTCNTCEISVIATDGAAIESKDDNVVLNLNDLAITYYGKSRWQSSYGLYLEKGTATLVSGTIDVSSDSTAYGVYMANTSSTFTMGVAEPTDSPNYATANATVSLTDPHIKSVGQTSGVGVRKVNGTFNFYDGLITASHEAKPDTTSNTEQRFEATFGTDENNYQTCYLRYLG